MLRSATFENHDHQRCGASMTLREPETFAPEDGTTSERAWRAVVDRDAGFDGRFVYAVVTTGIYCRPVCPARRPSRRNVRFFAGPATAEAAGFRACRRCRPDAPAERPGVRTVAAAVEYLESRAERPITLRELGAAVRCSPHHLHRLFKRHLGVSPRDYQAALRGDRLRTTLRESPTTSAAGYTAGFSSSGRLYEAGRANLGMTPGRYARGGEGLQVDFTLVGTSLGELLVGWTTRGVCLVLLGDSRESLVRAAAAELPAATLRPARATESGWVHEVIRCVEEGHPFSRDVPLDLHTTPFRLRVWQALRTIPAGETRSYGELAAELGMPGSARAVAGACAANPLAVVIPCHRVVRNDGGLAGYRWGLARKKMLLGRERIGDSAIPAGGAGRAVPEPRTK